MATFEELDALSTEELHDRAMRHAEHHADVVFFWRLLKAIPAAEMAAGDPAEAQLDRASAIRQLHDYRHRGEGLDEALRPIYIEYLLEHEHQ